MKQIQALLNDVKRFCDAPGCEGLIYPGELAVREYRIIGKGHYHHKRCWDMYHKERGKEVCFQLEDGQQ